MTRETKMEQEAQIWALIQQTGAELVVLARYMQILSDGLAAKLSKTMHQHPPLASCPASRAPSPTTRRTRAA